MFLRTLATVLIAVAAMAAPADRGVEQLVYSTSLPRIQVRVDPSLSYIGRVTGTAMRDRAEFEQFLFADIADASLKRALIVHFEHALPNTDLQFKYPRFEMLKLGKYEYLHQTFPVKDALLTAEPMAALLRSRGLTAAPEWVVSRYVRATDDNLKSEIIIFYLEPARDLPAPIEELGLAGSKRALWEPIHRRLSAEALRMFEVRDTTAARR